MKRLFGLVIALLLLWPVVSHQVPPAYAEACSNGAVVLGNAVMGFTSECWIDSAYYAQAYTYTKPTTTYATLSAWVEWWEECDGTVYYGGSTASPTVYNTNWVRAKGPQHGYYCSGINTHRYYARGQHARDNPQEVVYSKYP